jgi:DNA polymerase-3 subunit gamma/tau
MDKKYEVLYRKYRPESFNEIVGQAHIVDLLISQIKNEKISHSYIFYGSRGIGKTSIARIFGKELSISPNDTYEIDAASNRGIDDVRELREAVRSLPYESKYKLYIIDEFHMLTKEAFNALLKTLEEPPAHIIFILATTEIEKIPETIISRCQVYTFKRPNEETLSQVILSITEKEGYKISKDNALLIAKTGDGSFRDTLGNLQKVLHSDILKKEIDIENIETSLGLPRKVLIREFVKFLVIKDEEQLTGVLNILEKENFNMQLFLREVIYIFRELLLFRFLNKSSFENEVKVDKEFIEELVSYKSDVIQSKNISRLMQAYFETKNSFLKTLPLELAVIDILNKKD